VFAAARAAGAKTVLDVVTPGPAEYLSRLEKLLPHVDVFLPNNLEAELITGEKDPIRQAELFHELGAQTAWSPLARTGRCWSGMGFGCVPGCTRCPISMVAAAATPSTRATFTGYCTPGGRGVFARRERFWGRVACARSAPTPGVFTRPECEDFLHEHTLRIEKL